MQISLLEDFLDEEVADRRGESIGTLSCYWESASGHLYLGIKPAGDEAVHVVPGLGAQLDEHQSLVRVNFSAASIRTAPVFDCDLNLRPQLEQSAKNHFHISEP